MKGKIINGTLHEQSASMEIGGRMVSNPTDKQLTDDGWKDIVRTERPEGNYNEKYVETDTQIIVEWEEVFIEQI